jgi:hypothetical protein
LQLLDAEQSACRIFQGFPVSIHELDAGRGTGQLLLRRSAEVPGRLGVLVSFFVAGFE